MIRIIFDDGQLIECGHISQIYIDQCELKKIKVMDIKTFKGGVTCEGLSDLGSGETGDEIPLESGRCDGIYDDNNVRAV